MGSFTFHFVKVEVFLQHFLGHYNYIREHQDMHAAVPILICIMIPDSMNFCHAKSFRECAPGRYMVWKAFIYGPIISINNAEETIYTPQ